MTSSTMQRTAMHRFFTIYEICGHLVQLVNLDSTSKRRKNLLSLALTGKVFLNPCLSKIWGRLASLDPLFDLLPEDLVPTRASGHEYAEVGILIRFLSAFDWLLRYMPSVCSCETLKMMT